MQNSDEKSESLNPQPPVKVSRAAKAVRSSKAVYIYRASVSKASRQAAFRASCAGLSSAEAVAMARLIPDAASFRVVRICG